MNRSTESTSYSRHIGMGTVSPVERGGWSTGKLLRRRIRQGDAHWNHVRRLLLQFSSFAFGRFGPWIDSSQSPHSEADLPSFVWIGTGESRLEQRVGSLSGSFVSLFSDLFVNSFQFRCSGCWDGEVYVWDMQVDGAVPNPQKLSGHSGGVWSVAFSPDGRFLASADWNGKVLVWCTKVNPFLQ